MIDFVFIDRRTAEKDVHENVDGIDDDCDHEVDNRRSGGLVVGPEDSCDHRANNRDQQAWNSSAHSELRDNVLRKVVDHGEKGKLGSVGAYAHEERAGEKENEADELLFEEDGDEEDGEEWDIDDEVASDDQVDVLEVVADVVVAHSHDQVAREQGHWQKGVDVVASKWFREEIKGC